MVSTGNYLAGERSGEWTFFSAGEPFRIGSYEGGLEVGVWTTFHAGPARQKSEEGMFLDGERHGEWLTWYTSGVLSSRSVYEEGQQIAQERFDALGNPLTP